ncbi:MAG: TspO/MBR family protein [Gemmataceae bacterium]|nr:tryptophan-rich sensory protein [Gemmata sp.]MDW8197848.1 TspO/MBR family protein [Gemmataceae bacterium]
MSTTSVISGSAPVRSWSTGATWFGLAVWLGLCYAAMAFGGIFGADAWYAALRKPTWTPPNWVFPVVWPVLYTLMGIAAWLVWRKSGFAGAPWALGLFLAQLTFNAAWSYLFFGLHRMDLALVDITALWLLIAATIVTFRRHSVYAAALLVPYFLWVSFAAALNEMILIMNMG